MSFEQLNKLWRSAHNQPSREKLEQDRQKFILDLRRRRRGFTIFMSIVFVWLLLISARFVMHIVAPEPGSSAVNLTREWMVIPLFALPWIAWVCFVVQIRRHYRKHPDYEVSIRASVEALLDENQMARKRNLLIACLQGAFLLLLPVIVYQLKSVGKAGSEINAMFVMIPIIFGGILTGMVRHHRRTLLPRKLQLEGLLQSYKIID
jgi:hypothetical protein